MKQITLQKAPIWLHLRRKQCASCCYSPGGKKHFAARWSHRGSLTESLKNMDLSSARRGETESWIEIKSLQCERHVILLSAGLLIPTAVGAQGVVWWVLIVQHRSSPQHLPTITESSQCLWEPSFLSQPQEWLKRIAAGYKAQLNFTAAVAIHGTQLRAVPHEGGSRGPESSTAKPKC